MKLVTEIKTKQYELTYLVPGSMTDSELKKVQEIVQSLVKKYKGKLLSEEIWGKKPLAYTISKVGKNHSEAHYVHLVVELEASKTPAFEKDVYLIDEVIRHLLVEAEQMVEDSGVESKETADKE